MIRTIHGSSARRGEALSFDDYELEMDCTLDGEDLTCEGEHYDEEVFLELVPLEES